MKRSFALLAGLLFICTPLSRGAIVVWTNSVGGNWNAATNWSPNQVPSTADHAVITNAGTYTVIVDAGVTVDALTVGGASGHQTLSNFVATLTLNGNGAVGTNASFALNGGGVFAGTGELTVAGRFDWRGGIMQGAGRTVIAPGAVLDISGSDYHKQLYRALDLRGNGTFGGGGYLYGGFGVAFNIFAGSTFDLQGDQNMPYGGGGNYAQINVAGTLRKSAGSAVASIGFLLNNAGLVQAQSGTFSFGAGGWSSGQFDAANNTVLNFGGGTHTITNGVSFTATGSGFHRVDAGTLDIATALTMNPLLELTAGGVLAGNSNLTITSTLRWRGGIMQGAGRRSSRRARRSTSAAAIITSSSTARSTCAATARSAAAAISTAASAWPSTSSPAPPLICRATRTCPTAAAATTPRSTSPAPSANLPAAPWPPSASP